MGGASLSGIEFDSSTINSRSSCSTQIEPTTEFSTFIEKLSPILDEMKDSLEVQELPAVQKAFESLETDYRRARAAVEKQNIQSSPAKQIEYLTQNLGRSLGLVLFASHEVPMSNKQKIEALCKEMMNVKFDLSSENGFSEFADEAGEETEIETEIMEASTSMSSVDDAMMMLRYGDNEEDLKEAVLRLHILITNDAVSSEKIIEEDVIKVLCGRLSLSIVDESVLILQILRKLALQNQENKERIKEAKNLAMIVKLLAGEEDERREAVGLLLSLSDDSSVRRRIGRTPGCIVMLVAILKGEDEEASADAKVLLNTMSSNTQHALNIAEAGYFKPLIKYLKEGSDMSKVLMATALSRMELTDSDEASLGEGGAIEPLVKMFNTGNLEAKLSALNALQNLSNSKQNIKLLIKSGLVVALLQLLFSVTSVLMTLREPASAILAKVAKCEGILVKQDVAQQMLSLLNLCNPAIQSRLLEALNSIASHSSASKVRKRMKENGAIQLLLPFFTEKDSKIRIGALKLVHTLSEGTQGELTEQIGYAHVHVIASIVFSSASDSEKAAALGILSNMPVSDRKTTDLLKNANLLHLLSSILTSSHANPTPDTASLAESVAGLLIRFTVPTDKQLQHYSVEHGIIPLLLKLLSSSSDTAKSRAALCLAQLSQNSLHLIKSQRCKWFCTPSSSEGRCKVHNSHCTVKSTFCLVKAGAITPLIQILEGTERGADEAVLECLSTLLQDEIWERGCNFIGRSSGIPAIINVMQIGSPESQEKALWILERILRIDAYRAQYNESAETALVHLAHNGDPTMKPMISKLLAQLEVLQIQSSEF